MTATVTAVNQTQSLAAIRNFVRAAVSFITYARGLCSDNAYEQRPFLGLPLRQLIPSTTESITISEWIEKGAFDALNHGYLKEMSLCVYDATCTELLESYCFGFSYSADGQRAQMSLTASQNAEGRGTTAQGQETANEKRTTEVVTTGKGVPAYKRRRCSKQEVQGMLLHILERLLEVVGCLPPLLSKRVLTMRLTYYDEITPIGYEPPCFAPASRRMVQLYQEEVKLHVHVGAMDTSHHFFSVAIRHPLLQQIQSQIAEEIATAASTAAAAGQSAPLRSGLESTFSSTLPLGKGQESAPSTNGTYPIQRQAGIVADSGSAAGEKKKKHPSRVSDAAWDAGSDSRSAAEMYNGGGDHDAAEDEAAAAALPCRGSTQAPKRTRGNDHPGALSAVCTLVEEATAPATTRTLRPRELAYLLLASFIFSQAPSVQGGRGRVSRADVDAYRTQSCPLDLTEEATAQMLQQLAREGYLVPQLRNNTAATGSTLRVRSAAKDNQATLSAKIDAVVSEWIVPDPPLRVVQRLLRITALTQLLSHPCHVALQEVCVYLEREQVRTVDAVVVNSASEEQPRKRTRKV